MMLYCVPCTSGIKCWMCVLGKIISFEYFFVYCCCCCCCWFSVYYLRIFSFMSIIWNCVEKKTADSYLRTCRVVRAFCFNIIYLSLQIILYFSASLGCYLLPEFSVKFFCWYTNKNRTFFPSCFYIFSFFFLWWCLLLCREKLQSFFCCLLLLLMPVCALHTNTKRVYEK